MKSARLLVVLLALPLAAQQPEGWFKAGQLGEDAGKAWWGAGIWAAARQGPPAPLVQSLGMGNSLTGGGVLVEAGTRAGRWDLAAELLGVREPDGSAHLALGRGHVRWTSRSGWRAGFEQEPLVWGYGLQGGYLLGESARPFPRFRLESPYRDLSVLGVPLGAWGLQTFLGRLEYPRVLSPLVQDRSWRRARIAEAGDPQAPLLAGYRLQARFGPRLSFYLNMLNLWAGTRNGQAMTEGYRPGDWLTAAFGFKDVLAEGGHDPSLPPTAAPLRNQARSAGELDWGLRLEWPGLARKLGAEHAWLYVSRGSKSFAWPIRVFLRNPPRYLAKDVQIDLQNLAKGRFGFGWDRTDHYALPSELHPNDTVGLLAAYPRVRFGLEYQDTVNPVDTGHRPFAHGTYLTGFYYQGDALGSAQGGEARLTSARLEWDVRPALTVVTQALRGTRPFRDVEALWAADHPGASPGQDRMLGLQQELRCRVGRGLTLDLGAAWQRHGAVDYQAGRPGNGFAWFSRLGWRWPG